MAEQTVTLDPGESRQVTFQVTPQQAKEYQVLVNGLTGSFIAGEVAIQGGIGKWSYSVTCAYPDLHREHGDWPDHALDFDYDLYPSTFFISLKCYNDSDFEVVATMEIVDSNANIVHQPSPAFGDPTIEANDFKRFSFVFTLPRTPGEYYFDATLSFDGVIVDEGRWVIRYQ